MLPLFWLRVALSLYGVGLLYALASFWGGRKVLTRITLPAVGLGMVFHFVSIIENAMFSGTWTPTSMHGLESLLAFVLMVFFFVVYARFRVISRRANRAFGSVIRQHAMDLHPCRSDSHRILGALLQFCRQHSVPYPGAEFKDQSRDEWILVASARAGHDRRNRLQVPDLGLPLHDAGTDRRFDSGGSAVWKQILCRS